VAKLGYESAADESKGQSNPGDGLFGIGDESNAGVAPVGKQTSVLDLSAGAKNGAGLCTAEGPEGGDLTLGTEHDVDPFARNFS
jgi:hypothetical protein